MAHSLPRHNDETTKLTKILTDFAEEIIDISVVDHIETLKQINEQIQNNHISDSDRTLILRVSKQMESMLGSMRVEQSEEVRELVVGLGDNMGE